MLDCHLVNTELATSAFLSASKVLFDVASDIDLHRLPDLLKPYKVVVISGHSEYWSAEMYQHLERFQATGGNIVLLSGMSMYWRVSFDDEFSIMECRKIDGMASTVSRFESYHSTDRGRGGLLRDFGHAGHQLTGLEYLGGPLMNIAPDETPEMAFGPFIARMTQHFMYQEPQKSQIQDGEEFAEDSNGHEVDVRAQMLMSVLETTPPGGAVWPVMDNGITLLGSGRFEKLFHSRIYAEDYWGRPVKPSLQGGEVVYWDVPSSSLGKVLSVGSVQAAPALLRDHTLSLLVSNALFHFCAFVPCTVWLPRASRPYKNCEKMLASGLYSESLVCYNNARAPVSDERSLSHVMAIHDALYEWSQAIALANKLAVSADPPIALAAGTVLLRSGQHETLQMAASACDTVARSNQTSSRMAKTIHSMAMECLHLALWRLGGKAGDELIHRRKTQSGPIRAHFWPDDDDTTN